MWKIDTVTETNKSHDIDSIVHLWCAYLRPICQAAVRPRWTRRPGWSCATDAAEAGAAAEAASSPFRRPEQLLEQQAAQPWAGLAAGDAAAAGAAAAERGAPE